MGFDHVWENRDLIVEGFAVTLRLFAVSGLLALIFGTLLAVMRVGRSRRCGGRGRSTSPWSATRR